MNGELVRRTFFKRLLSISAFASGSFLAFKRTLEGRVEGLCMADARAMNNPDYAMGRFKDRLTIEYYGLSCFLITSSNGTKIITDPFLADKQVLHSELKKEPADVVTVSCGHFAHCNVFAVGGTPYVYQITDPTEIKGIKFRGIASRHLAMKEVSTADPADNIIICFEIDGIKICHLGALGHKLSDEQVKKIGKVDILMLPVGGVSTLSLADAEEVCNQLNSRVILPMHYRSERCNFESWATVDEFVKGKKNVLRKDTNVHSSELEFKSDELPVETQIIVQRFVY
ncbi:MAG TPA: MBL fold metallo-hydrolase [Bacteroidales bacterium]|nr:MBL fold metallo-hydrolase [Bacteroidales bacterium]